MLFTTPSLLKSQLLAGFVGGGGVVVTTELMLRGTIAHFGLLFKAELFMALALIKLQAAAPLVWSAT